jgi:hypothetical protein
MTSKKKDFMKLSHLKKFKIFYANPVNFFKKSNQKTQKKTTQLTKGTQCATMLT